MRRKIYWTDEIAGAHILFLPYESPCVNLHGHNWKIEVEIESFSLNNGMILDYKIIGKIVKRLDHKLIVPKEAVSKKVDMWVYIDMNGKHLEVPEDEVVIIPFENVTSERMAQYIAKKIMDEIMDTKWKNSIVTKVLVRVWEDSRSYAEYEFEGRDNLKLLEM